MEWEWIGEWRAFISLSQLQAHHCQKLPRSKFSLLQSGKSAFISLSQLQGHRRNQLSKTAVLNKVKVLVKESPLNIKSGFKFAVSEVSWSTPGNSSRCYLGEVFSQHVIPMLSASAP